MRYTGTICGVTEERFTYKVPISVGCPYNACAFCMFYKNADYRELPLEQIEAELARVNRAGGAPTRIMLGDGNPLWTPFDRLKQIIEMIEHYLPSCSAICSDASILAIEQKTDAELAWLADHGYRMVYVGIESGLDDVLLLMNKDHDNDQAREQISRLHAAGIDFGAHIMTGVAGAGRGLENARATAALLNELRPKHICDFTMYAAGTPEMRELESKGLFCQAGPIELLQEMRELASLVEAPESGLFFEGYCSAFLRKPEGKGAGPGATVLSSSAGEFVKKNLLLKGDLAARREAILADLDAAIESSACFEAAYTAKRDREGEGRCAAQANTSAA